MFSCAWAGGDTDTITAEMRRLLRLSFARALVLGLATVIVFHGHPAAAVLVASVSMLRAVSVVLGITLIAQRRYRALSASSVGVTMVQSVATSWVAIATHDPALTVGVFFAGQLVDVAVAFALAPWPLIRHRSTAATKLPRLEMKTLLSFYALGLCQLVIFGKSETIVLHYTNQSIALGLFAVATTLAARATLLTDALYGALLPSLGVASIRGRDGAAQAYSTALRFSSILVLLTALVLGPAIVVVGPILFGASGGAVRAATAVILGGSLLQTFVYPLTAIASLEMQRGAIALPAALGALLDVAAAVLLIPRFGLAGAAIASLVAGLTFGLGFCVMVRLHGSALRTLRAQLIRVGLMISALIAVGVLTQDAAPAVAAGAMWCTAIVVYLMCRAGGGVLIGEDVGRLKAAAPRLALRLPRTARGLAVRALLVHPGQPECWYPTEANRGHTPSSGPQR